MSVSRRDRRSTQSSLDPGAVAENEKQKSFVGLLKGGDEVVEWSCIFDAVVWPIAG